MICLHLIQSAKSKVSMIITWEFVERNVRMMWVEQRAKKKLIEKWV